MNIAVLGIGRDIAEPPGNPAQQPHRLGSSYYDGISVADMHHGA